MFIRFGIAPIAWTNSDLPQLGGDTSLETCLTESRAAGYSGTETGVKFPMGPGKLGSILKSHRLALVSGWFSGELLSGSLEREKERMAGQLATFKALGAPLLIYAETSGSVQAKQDRGISGRPRLTDEEIRSYGRKLTELAEWMAGEGMPMSYHHHMGTVIENEREVDLLMRHTGAAVGLLLDTGHLTYAGASVLDTTRRHARRINHVHCKDIRWDVLKAARQEDMSFLNAILDGVFTVPGDGMIDYYAFTRLLAEIGYSGWAVVEAEQDPVKAPPARYAKLGHRHLTEAFRAAGYEIRE
jgi:inosose dehydratase